MPSSGAQEWLDKAAEDEETVRLVSENGGPWAVAAFHLQQAAEKILKAALIESGVLPPRTHDLTSLLELFSGAPPDQTTYDAASVLGA